MYHDCSSVPVSGYPLTCLATALHSLPCTAVAHMAAEEGAPLVRLEQAASDRSHCRATGEAIPKGAWRVGLEVWVPGRMGVTWTWQVGPSRPAGWA